MGDHFGEYEDHSVHSGEVVLHVKDCGMCYCSAHKAMDLGPGNEQQLSIVVVAVMLLVLGGDLYAGSLLGRALRSNT